MIYQSLLVLCIMGGLFFILDPLIGSWTDHEPLGSTVYFSMFAGYGLFCLFSIAYTVWVFKKQKHFVPAQADPEKMPALYEDEYIFQEPFQLMPEAVFGVYNHEGNVIADIELTYSSWWRKAVSVIGLNNYAGIKVSSQTSSSVVHLQMLSMKETGMIRRNYNVYGNGRLKGVMKPPKTKGQDLKKWMLFEYIKEDTVYQISSEESSSQAFITMDKRPIARIELPALGAARAKTAGERGRSHILREVDFKELSLEEKIAIYQQASLFAGKK